MKTVKLTESELKYTIKRVINESLPPRKKITMWDDDVYNFLWRAYNSKSEEEFTQVVDDALHGGKRPKGPNPPPGVMM